MRRIIFLLSITIFLSACQSSNILTIRNDYPIAVSIRFLFPYQNDTTNYYIQTARDSSIQSPVFSSTTTDMDLELRSILVRIDTNGKYIVLRFSNNYLELKKWTLRIPFYIPQNQKYQKLEITDKIRAIDSYAYYFGVQELYNAGRYSECLEAIMDVFPLLDEISANIKGNIARSVEKQYSIFANQAITHHYNFLLLAYLCAYKTNDHKKAAFFRKELQYYAPRVIEYLQENDYEISKFNAG